MKKWWMIFPAVIFLISILAQFSLSGSSSPEQKYRATSTTRSYSTYEAQKEFPTPYVPPSFGPIPTVPPTFRVIPSAKPSETPSGFTYVLNTNTKKFHKPTCSSVDQMKESNKKYFTGTREEVIAMGYDPCGRCHP